MARSEKRGKTRTCAEKRIRPHTNGQEGSVVSYTPPKRGGVAEWLKAAVLKTAVPQGTVGSNPTPSAIPRVHNASSAHSTEELLLIRYRTLVLVRHGEYRTERLTPLGRMQAAHTARRIGPLPITAIHCSTMTRAVETALILANGRSGRNPVRARRHVPVRAHLLRECIPSLPPHLQQSSTALTAEMIRRGKDQAERAYRRYFRRAVRRNTCEVLVCHGNLIRYLVCRALGLREHAWVGLGTSHCGVTVIRIPSKGPVVLDTYNDTGHLPERLRNT